MANDHLLTTIDGEGRATLTLNRPKLHNAFDDALIAEMTTALRRLAIDPAVRVVCLAAAGKSFSAGADLAWMRRMADYTYEENVADAMALAELMTTLDTLPKPTIALVQGAAYGGGVGLVAACDMVLATPEARFCLSEVKLGLIPAVISPYVVRAIGSRAARRYFVSAELFDADEACRLGLVHRIVPAFRLQSEADHLVRQLLKNGPQAMAAAKKLVRDVADRPIDEALIAETAARIAATRAGDEGREGLAAFLEKRRPSWCRGDASDS
ncbi:methylglutaconyl-CoA hydratase [Geothermobacter ehrlichii]|uniref:Methylglutaconyl-CoA hydratase n=1 Tax=Geothermobacter ehrlichii TaxID=213224 RepID=A0A5D3WKZ1_9BACT|nr:enoyl-CoA hydratase/isomerase family protein [Geothermobacter ehrlichii]TYO98596.1 methylglutaconyl-CoA hydratase [Geothermobacter ehrlichii]